MAHEIEHRADRHTWSFAFTGERSAIWHRHGQQAQPNWSAEEWMRQSNQDFEIEKISLAEAMGHTGAWLANMTHALRRKDNGAVMSVCSQEWSPAQNSNAYAFLAPLMDAGFCSIDTAGTLFDGRRCFVLAKTKEGFNLPGGDDTEGYLLVQISHEYGIADLVMPTAVRVVCNNTLQMALGSKNKAQMDAGRFVHRAKTAFSVEKANALVEAYRAGLGEYAEQAKFLTTKQARPEQIRAYINKVFKLEELKEGSVSEIAKRREHNDKVVKALAQSIEKQPGAAMSAGSWWSAFNGVTWHEDHERWEGKDEPITGKFQGTGADRKRAALKVALEMAA